MGLALDLEIGFGADVGERRATGVEPEADQCVVVGQDHGCSGMSAVRASISWGMEIWCLRQYAARRAWVAPLMEMERGGLRGIRRLRHAAVCGLGGNGRRDRPRW